MIVRSFKDIEGTDRHVRAASGTWESKRIVLARERVGFSLHETILYAGTETSMHYANHIEAVVCVEGEAELTDHESGLTHTVGFWWAVADLDYFMGYVDNMAKQTPEDLRRYAARYIVGKPHVAGVLLNQRDRAALNLKESDLIGPASTARTTP